MSEARIYQKLSRHEGNRIKNRNCIAIAGLGNGKGVKGCNPMMIGCPAVPMTMVSNFLKGRSRRGGRPAQKWSTLEPEAQSNDSVFSHTLAHTQTALHTVCPHSNRTSHPCRCSNCAKHPPTLKPCEAPVTIPTSKPTGGPGFRGQIRHLTTPQGSRAVPAKAGNRTPHALRRFSQVALPAARPSVAAEA